MEISNNINWVQLREQKSILLITTGEDSDDKNSLQDAVVEQGVATEDEVFGKEIYVNR